MLPMTASRSAFTGNIFGLLAARTVQNGTTPRPVNRRVMIVAEDLSAHEYEWASIRQRFPGSHWVRPQELLAERGHISQPVVLVDDRTRWLESSAHALHGGVPPSKINLPGLFLFEGPGLDCLTENLWEDPPVLEQIRSISSGPVHYYRPPIETGQLLSDLEESMKTE